MCENLKLYNAVCNPPKEALKPIEAGRLKGMTDINPMWRIKELTRQFGPCGIGWNIINTKFDLIPIGDTGEVVCFCELDLVFKANGSWSEPVHGIGGNKLVAKEKSGLYADDEAYKKAYTDAIGTACKALGFAGNIYWEKDPTKYTKQEPEEAEPTAIMCSRCGKTITPLKLKSGSEMTPADVAQNTQKLYGQPMCAGCWEDAKRVNA